MAGKTMQITDLRIYPIKSCRGISLPQTTLTRQGLKYDRKWMFIDSNKDNKFVTIRENSSMTLIKTALNPSTQCLEITFPSRKESGLDSTTISIPLDPSPSYLETDCTKIEVEIWKHNTDAYTYTSSTVVEAVSNFFQSVAPNSDVKLVMKGPTPRIAQGNGSPSELGREESVNFPDVLPVLVASDVSLQELNSRLRERNEPEISIERFRPNIIVGNIGSGGDIDSGSGSSSTSTSTSTLIPWEEDEWRLLRISPSKSLFSSLSNAVSTLPGASSAAVSIDLDVSARCARCQVPNVDPDTAEKHPKEPWSVLYSYRRVDEGIKVKPCFGMLCCPRSEGEVKVGMEVEVREVMEAAGGRGSHRYIKGF